MNTTSMTRTKKVQVLSYKGATYVFHKTDDKEEETVFSHRCWWIVKNHKMIPDETLEVLIQLSHIWASVKFLGVMYDDDIMMQLSLHRDIYKKQ